MDTNGFVFLKLRQESATSGRHSLVGATRLGADRQRRTEVVFESRSLWL
jgi:hypothetical protein